ncbi:MAG: glycosyltransferase family 4 protein [Candidatus Aenigmarchaeota archaeon]|nr:glycosyltransferase family 4 protein [Candidatus Aenigmarchaeota archaeon]
MNVLLSLSTSASVKAGVETFSDHLCRALGLHIVDYDRLRAQFPEPFSVIRQPTEAKRLDHWFADHLAEYDPDVIFTNGMDGWALQTDRPVVNIQHGTFAGFARAAMRQTDLNYWRTRILYARYERRSAQRARQVVANSPFTQRNVRRFYRLDSAVIPNAVDTEMMRPVPQAAARKRLGLPAGATIGVFVGRPDYSKGFDVVRQVAALRPDILFLCVFPFPYHLEGNFQVRANIPSRRMKDMYSAADFCIAPTRFEGFGYAPLEALACNTPVIGNRTGIFLDHDLPGFTPATDAATYAAALPLDRARSRPGLRPFSFSRFRQRYKQLVNSIR